MMLDYPIAWDWASFAVRWLHVITAIAWIGSSFYFIALDLGLRKGDDLPEGASGEEWQVHGGGFYHIRKYMVAPAQMPEHLTWFKWESYSTWMSGFALLAIVYYGGASIYLIDPNVLALETWQAIAISLASLGFGWVLYDLLCKSGFGQDNRRLMLFLYGVLVLMGWGFGQVFSGRAAFLHLGAFTATIMTANVFFIIMPNQRIVVSDLKAGRKPDPKYGKIAKQRSTHNNYLTLPVIFFMLSNHYPLAFATRYSWIIAALVFLMGVTIRHYFNSVHGRTGNPIWTWPVTVALFLIIIWLSTMPMALPEENAPVKLSAMEQRFVTNAMFVEARDTVIGRCSMCHAAEPVWEGIIAPPKGVMLDTDENIARHAREIYLQAGRSHAMPPGNLTEIEPQERLLLVNWYESAIKG